MDRAAGCPASVSPKCNSEGRHGVKANPHTSGGAEAAVVAFTQLCVRCRRERSDYGFSSAGRDIPTVHVYLHPTGVMNISHPTWVRPRLPLAVSPAVPHVSVGCCRSEQQDVSWATPLGWWLPPRQAACTAILIISLWFDLWGKNKLHFFLSTLRKDTLVYTA